MDGQGGSVFPQLGQNPPRCWTAAPQEGQYSPDVPPCAAAGGGAAEVWYDWNSWTGTLSRVK